MTTTLVYLQYAAVCPTRIFESEHVNAWILIWFIFKVLPYVLHESMKLNICICMDTNFDYLQHAAVCPT